MTTSLYNCSAADFFAQYQSLAFESVHASWLPLLRSAETERLALDVGAGSGRDSSGLAALGYHVLAVEPAAELRKLGSESTQGQSIEWLCDTLPSLSRVQQRADRYDLILVSAVWMHLAAGEQEQALPVLEGLLAPEGLLVITLRHGPSGDARVFHETDSVKLRDQGVRLGLKTILLAGDDDKLQRRQVSWETVVFQKGSSRRQHGGSR